MTIKDQIRGAWITLSIFLVTHLCATVWLLRGMIAVDEQHSQVIQKMQLHLDRVISLQRKREKVFWESEAYQKTTNEKLRNIESRIKNIQAELKD